MANSFIHILLIDGDGTMRDIRRQILSNISLGTQQIKVTALAQLPAKIKDHFDLVIIDAQLLKPHIEANLRELKQRYKLPMMVLYKKFDTVSIARKIVGAPAGLFATNDLNRITQKWAPKIFHKAVQH